MSHSKAYDRVLDAYGKEKRAELDATTRKLINQASYDLWYGPCDEDDFPGFVKACKLIAAEIDSVVDTGIYIDTDAEIWSTEPPEDDFDLQFLFKVDYRDCVCAIVGDKELVEYVTR